MRCTGGLSRLREAVIDALHLLERGYSREVVVRIVGDRYGLDRALRSVIYRCVHPDRVVRAILRKTSRPDALRGRWLNIDGLNVLGTLMSLLSGGLIVLSLDGIYRDVSEIHASLLRQSGVRDASLVLMDAARRLMPSGVRILLEEQVSGSGEAAGMLRRMLAEAGVGGEVFTTRQVDTTLIKLSGITCTSDSVVASRCERLFDLPGYCITVMGYGRGGIIDLRSISASEWWCDNHAP